MISEADCKAAAAELGAASLTPREREVLVLMGKGLGRGEIADSLELTTKTIDTHLMGMRKKLRMTTIEAVVLAVKAGWV